LATHHAPWSHSQYLDEGMMKERTILVDAIAGDDVGD
jgi:hypothetical protein